MNISRIANLVLPKISAALLIFAAGCGDETAADFFRTSPVTRGTIATVIKATGTIEPEDLIDVGAQVTGQILAFGKDKDGKELDYCSRVAAGQLLAEIDSVTYEADLRIAKANLVSANESLTRSEAELKQLKAKAAQATRNWERAQKIGVGDAMSQASFDAYCADFEIANANVEVGEAGVKQAKAAIEQAKANVEKAERNLSYCKIISPADGVIIDRRVNIGQTVVSSMSTSSLFLLAKDLSRIQIWVPVNEADIGNIHAGMKVSFTVDAFPGRTFAGVVEKIRLNASMTSNVVTYTVEITTENPDGLLLPYLTANVSFIIAESSATALSVPVSALRWAPAGKSAATGETPCVFVIGADGAPRALAVKTGISNGSRTEISGAEISAETRVITGTLTAAEAAENKKDGNVNPFLPKPPKMDKSRRRAGPPAM